MRQGAIRWKEHAEIPVGCVRSNDYLMAGSGADATTDFGDKS